MRVRMKVVVLCLVLLGAACTQTTDNTTPVVTAASGDNNANKTTTSSKTNDTKPPDAEGKPTQTERNKNAKTYREALKLAMADIQQFWTDTLPEIYGQDYEPIPDKNLFPATEKKPGPACTPEGGQNTYEDVHNNAFYCRLGKFVEWDDQDLLPKLYTKYGEYSVAMVFAHEWGHAIQDQMGNLGKVKADGTRVYPTIYTENQADCFAGAWTKHSLENKSDKSFRAYTSDLTAAVGGMLQFADTPGGVPTEQGAHGTGFDRVNAFQIGFEEGAQRCTEFLDNPPNFINQQFKEGDDKTGNAPYDDEKDEDGNVTATGIITLATNDLNAYWEKLGVDAGFDFKKVESIQIFSTKTNMPKCGSQQYSEDEALNTIFFCIDDDYVAWDEDFLKEAYKAEGDTGVAVLLAEQWAVSAQVQDNQPKETIESKAGKLQQSCFTGAWLRAVKEGDAHNGGTVVLSPGDLDEAIKAYLAFSDTPDSKDEAATASAFENVEAFRDGFLAGDGEGDNYDINSGAQQCASYSTK
jgi:predicted metalloprotease